MSDGFTPQFVFEEIRKGIEADPSLVSKVGGIFHFKVGGKSWTVDLKNGKGSVNEGAPAKADCTVICGEQEFIDLMLGKANGQTLFMKGKLKLQGNMGLAMKLDKIPKVSKSAPTGSVSPPASGGAAAAASSGLRSAEVFKELEKRIGANPELAKSVAGVYQFDIKDAAGKVHVWTVDLKSGKGSVKEGKASNPDCTLLVGDDDFVGMMTGKLNSQQLFMKGKLKIKGNMSYAMKLGKLSAAKASL